MQRLFTTFADGWPGLGLLVQRLVIGAVLLRYGTILLREAPADVVFAPQAIGAVLGIFILIGLWTPIVGVLVTCVELWTALVSPGDPTTAILIATLSTALAMIGPGAFSIDARRFGRKHIRR